MSGRLRAKIVIGISAFLLLLAQLEFWLELATKNNSENLFLYLQESLHA